MAFNAGSGIAYVNPAADYQRFKNFVRLTFTPGNAIPILAARAGNYDGVGTAPDGALITTALAPGLVGTLNLALSPQTGAAFGAITANTVIAPVGPAPVTPPVFGRGPGLWRAGDENLFDVKIYDMSMSVQGGLGQTPLVYVAQIAFVQTAAAIAAGSPFGDILIGIHNRGANPVEAPGFVPGVLTAPTMIIDIAYRHSAGL